MNKDTDFCYATINSNKENSMHESLLSKDNLRIHWRFDMASNDNGLVKKIRMDKLYQLILSPQKKSVSGYCYAIIDTTKKTMPVLQSCLPIYWKKIKATEEIKLRKSIVKLGKEAIGIPPSFLVKDTAKYIEREYQYALENYQNLEVRKISIKSLFALMENC